MGAARPGREIDMRILVSSLLLGLLIAFAPAAAEERAGVEGLPDWARELIDDILEGEAVEAPVAAPSLDRTRAPDPRLPGAGEAIATADDDLADLADPEERIVEEIQLLLAALGYDPGPIDGVLGRQTREALARFQREHGLEATGEPGTAVRDRLRFERAIASDRDRERFPPYAVSRPAGNHLALD